MYTRPVSVNIFFMKMIPPYDMRHQFGKKSTHLTLKTIDLGNKIYIDTFFQIMHIIFDINNNTLTELPKAGNNHKTVRSICTKKVKPSVSRI